MNFASPLMLIGLLAVAVPLIVHLIHRRQAVRRPFPALRLLLESRERIARGLKVKQALLLALRMLLFAAIPFAMARPALDCSGTADADAVDDRRPASVILVLDTSASMSLAPAGDGTLWDDAVADAGQRLRNVRTWDRVQILAAGSEVRTLLPAEGGTRADAEAALRALEPDFSQSDLPAALAEAREIHRALMQPTRRTFVFTDDRAHSWASTSARPDALAGLGPTSVIRVGPQAHGGHVVLTTLELEEASDVGPGAWRVSAQVRAYGDPGARPTAELFVHGERQLQQQVSIQPDGTATATFVTTVEGHDPVPVTVRLANAPRMTALAERHGLILPMGGLRTLLVNGDPRSQQHADELFYVNAALGAVDRESRPIRTREIIPSRLSPEDLDGIDVAVLANVDRLSGEAVGALTRFVQGGGGLLLTVGDQVDPDAWNSALAPVLPRPLRTIRTLTDRSDPDARIKATRIAGHDANHPMLRVFRGRSAESLRSATVYSYALLEPGGDDDVRTLIEFGDGAPALVSRRVGRGRVLLWTTTIDFDWTDFPIRTAFVPFLHRSLVWLGGAASGAVEQGETGRTWAVRPDEEQAVDIDVTDPAGDRWRLPADAGTARHAVTRRGPHSAQALDDAGEPVGPARWMVAHAPAEQAETTPASDEDRGPWLEAAGSGAQVADAGDGTPPGRALWGLLLFLAVLLLYAESLVSLRRHLWQKVLRRT